MDYKNMTDSELAAVMVRLINRVLQLEDAIGQYLNGISVDEGYIRQGYTQLKSELRACAHYLDLCENKNGSRLYTAFFAPSILEAAAWGFTAPINCRINHRMFSSVEEACYKLRKYLSLKDWEQLM